MVKAFQPSYTGVEAGLKVQGQSGLLSEFSVSLSNLVRPQIVPVYLLSKHEAPGFSSKKEKESRRA